MVVQEVHPEADGFQRVERLAHLLSQALVRQLAQAHPAAPESPTTPLDCPTVVLPTSGAKFAVPTEEE